MTTQPLSEFGLIDQIREMFSGVPAPGMQGIGDDCAVIPFSETASLVITTDLLGENVHFWRDKISPDDLGYKSLAVSLSDVAAMGAAPIGSFLSLALPSGVPAEWIGQFLKGYHELSATYGVPLLGGDTTSSDGKITISVTAIGEAKTQHLKYRRNAKSGDKILVTGKLGGSAKGFLQLSQPGWSVNTPLFDHTGVGPTEYPLREEKHTFRNDPPQAEPEAAFIRLHNRPEPQTDQGIWLGEQTAVHAMMDLSDGLASDLNHILRASGVAAQIELMLIPTYSAQQVWPEPEPNGPDRPEENTLPEDLKLALTGGEDYRLLFTAAPEQTEKLQSRYQEKFGEPLYVIGEIKEGNPHIVWLKNGKIQDLNIWGFSHF